MVRVNEHGLTIVRLDGDRRVIIDRPDQPIYREMLSHTDSLGGDAWESMRITDVRERCEALEDAVVAIAQDCGFEGLIWTDDKERTTFVRGQLVIEKASINCAKERNWCRDSSILGRKQLEASLANMLKIWQERQPQPEQKSYQYEVGPYKHRVVVTYYNHPRVEVEWASGHDCTGSPIWGKVEGDDWQQALATAIRKVAKAMNAVLYQDNELRLFLGTEGTLTAEIASGQDALGEIIWCRAEAPESRNLAMVKALAELLRYQDDKE